MKVRWGLALVILAAALGGAEAPAVAQDRLPFFGEDELFAPPDVGQPNRYGCVKECVRDFNPCDSLMVKQREGRCNNGRRN